MPRLDISAAWPNLRSYVHGSNPSGWPFFCPGSKRPFDGRDAIAEELKRRIRAGVLFHSLSFQDISDCLSWIVFKRIALCDFSHFGVESIHPFLCGTDVAAREAIKGSLQQKDPIGLWLVYNS